MNASQRWQDWVTVALGVLLAAAPLAIGTLGTIGAWTSYAIGALLVLSGLWSVSMTEPTATVEMIPAFLGIVLVAAPWALGFTGEQYMSWVSWAVGALSVVNAGGEIFFGAKPRAA